MKTDSRLYFHAGSTPHYQGQIYDEETGQTVAITYDDEGGRIAQKLAASPALLDSLHELLEICRYKCSPLDEIILPSGKSNERAMIDAMAAIAEAEYHAEA
jgi:hypothetical protein